MFIYTYTSTYMLMDIHTSAETCWATRSPSRPPCWTMRSWPRTSRCTTHPPPSPSTCAALSSSGFLKTAVSRVCVALTYLLCACVNISAPQVLSLTGNGRAGFSSSIEGQIPLFFFSSLFLPSLKKGKTGFS